MNQVEFSRTVVLDWPPRARAFFEHVITGHIALGRPEQVELIFNKRVQVNTPRHFYTRVLTPSEQKTALFAGFCSLGMGPPLD